MRTKLEEKKKTGLRDSKYVEAIIFHRNEKLMYKKLKKLLVTTFGSWWFSIYTEGSVKYFKIRFKSFDKAVVFNTFKGYKIELNPYDELTECGKVVGEYLDLFFDVFSAQSKLILTSKEDKHPDITERLIHLIYNMRGSSLVQESYGLSNLAVQRAYTAGALASEGDKK